MLLTYPIYIKSKFIIILTIANVTPIKSQPYPDFTYNKIINLGLENAAKSTQITLKKEINDINLSILKSMSKPTLNLSSNFPLYDRDNFAVRQPDGTIIFRDRKQLYSNMNMSFSKPLPTGGTLTINSGIFRFDNLINKSKQYSTIPFSIVLKQKLFGFNDYKYQKEIIPYKSDNFNREITKDYSELKLKIVESFFNFIEVQNLIKQHLFKIETLSKILKNELIRDSIGNGKADRIIDLKIELENLKVLNENLKTQKANYLISLKNNFNIIIPENSNFILPPFIKKAIPYEKTKFKDSITKNNFEYNSSLFTKFLLENERKKIRQNKNSIQLSFGYGLNQTNQFFVDAFTNLQQQQRFNIELNFLLFDWKKNKLNENLASKNLQYQNLLIKEVETLLLNNIETLLTTFNSSTNLYYSFKEIQLQINKKLNNNLLLYEIGKISFTELNQVFLNSQQVENKLIEIIKNQYITLHTINLICNCDMVSELEINDK